MKNKLKFLLALLVTVWGMNGVKAATCELERQSQLSAIAYNVNYDYVEYKEENTTASGTSGDYGTTVNPVYQYGFNINLYNITDDVYVKLTDQNSGSSYNLFYANSKDGTITIDAGYSTEVKIYNVEILANDNNCKGSSLRTFTITLPRYNFYSNFDVCAEIPEYYYCQTYLTTDDDISYTDLNKGIAEYKEQQAKEKKQEEFNNSAVGVTLSFIGKYKFYIIGAAVVVGGLITFVVIKKKRSRLI